MTLVTILMEIVVLHHAKPAHLDISALIQGTYSVHVLCVSLLSFCVSILIFAQLCCAIYEIAHATKVFTLALAHKTTFSTNKPLYIHVVGLSKKLTFSQLEHQ